MKLTSNLARRSSFHLAWQFGKLESAAAWRKLSRSVGQAVPQKIDFTELAPPESVLTQKATALFSQVAPQFLVNHGIRSYCFAAALARKYGWKFDREVVFTAALLHDLGLTHHCAGPGSFETRGAKCAHTHLVDSGMEKHRADIVHEAIALHSAVGIADKKDIEVRLTHFGSGVDVIGFRSEDVAPETQSLITTTYPRLNFKTAFTRLLEGEISENPQCHIAGHMALGFRSKIRNAPFRE